MNLREASRLRKPAGQTQIMGDHLRRDQKKAPFVTERRQQNL